MKDSSSGRGSSAKIPVKLGGAIYASSFASDGVFIDFGIFTKDLIA